MILGVNKYFIFPIILFLFSCNENSNKILVNNIGYAQGTTYNIKYFSENVDFQTEIDSVLNIIDLSMSHYIDSSLVSGFNQAKEYFVINHHFRNIYNQSNYISNITFGSFDCTIYPLIDFWGFLKQNKDSLEQINYVAIDSLLQYVNYKHVWLEGDSILFKKDSGIKLDFNGIAQGYTVDVVCDFLESKNIFDYLVEIGGEVRCNNKYINKEWKIGIEKPIKKRHFNNFENIVVLDNMSLATSGNYRKFNFVNGRKISHHISPFSGMPVSNKILSVSVLSEKCSFADAISSAFMVMGIDSIRSISTKYDIEYFLIYENNFGDTISEFSNGFKRRLIF